jgi:hypothetical protein
MPRSFWMLTLNKQVFNLKKVANLSKKLATLVTKYVVVIYASSKQKESNPYLLV